MFNVVIGSIEEMATMRIW